MSRRDRQAAKQRIEKKQRHQQELRGVELVGSAEVLDAPDQLWELGVSMYERYFGPYTEEARPAVEAMLHKRVAVRMRADRIVSWDHSKIAAA